MRGPSSAFEKKKHVGGPLMSRTALPSVPPEERAAAGLHHVRSMEHFFPPANSVLRQGKSRNAVFNLISTSAWDAGSVCPVLAV